MEFLKMNGYRYIEEMYRKNFFFLRKKGDGRINFFTDYRKIAYMRIFVQNTHAHIYRERMLMRITKK